MNETEKAKEDAGTITRLEKERFAAIVNRDFDAFRAIAHPELMYTHSNGNTDTLELYMQKCQEGFYVYHRIDHPVTKIVVNGDVALVFGEMNADLTVGGTSKRLNNASLAVWVREGKNWKFIAYQPTPKPVAGTSAV